MMSSYSASLTQTVAKPAIMSTYGNLLQRAAISPSPVYDVPFLVHQMPCMRNEPAATKTRSVMEPRLGHEFSRIRVSSAQPGIPQARLFMGQPGDRFEREADSVADLVMRFTDTGSEQSQPPTLVMGGESLRRASDESADGGPTPRVDQTEEDTNSDVAEEGPRGGPADVAMLLLEADDLEGVFGPQATSEQPIPVESPPAERAGDATLQPRELPGETPTVSAKQESMIHALRGGGQPLSVSSRAFFEPRFGHNLGHVRVHVGTEASRLAQSVQAKAFTVGRDVVFGEGHYQPASATGRWLMAHELTHVLQQQEGLSRSPAAGVQVQHTGRTQLQGGFFGKVWSGIKKGASAVWGGVKKGASAVWRGTKWAAGKAWSGIKAVGRWGWNVLKSGAALVWNLVTKFPERVWRLIKHLGSGIAGVASWLWEGLKLAWHLNFKGLGNWLLDGVLSGAAWVGRLIGKLVDIAGLGEVWDLLSQIIKFNTRPLTSEETSEAQKTFQGSISYWQVRVDEYSLIAKIGALFQGSKGMGVTTFHTINFNHQIAATPGSSDMHWLTHELTHVSQYEHAGSQYLGEAIHAQATAGYDYQPKSNPLWRPPSHPSPNVGGKHFREFNREQQGDIAADYYYSLFGHTVSTPSGPFTPVTSDYEPVINELRGGDV